MLGVKEVCTLLGISRTTLWSMVRDGEIGAVKCGTRLLFPRAVLDEYVAAQAAQARAAAAQRQRTGRSRWQTRR
jgi:excisionase family DNA binding protein